MLNKLRATLLLSSALLVGSSAIAIGHEPSETTEAAAEIQIFVNYRGSNDYDQKIVSRHEDPVSAEWLYVVAGEEPLNGACYKGDALSAIDLFEKMVDRFNRETDRDLEVTGSSYYDEETRRTALTFTGHDHVTGEDFVWFERMRECVRWSTPRERGED